MDSVVKDLVPLEPGKVRRLPPKDFFQRGKGLWLGPKGFLGGNVRFYPLPNFSERMLNQSSSRRKVSSWFGDGGTRFERPFQAAKSQLGGGKGLLGKFFEKIGKTILTDLRGDFIFVPLYVARSGNERRRVCGAAVVFFDN